MCNHGRLENLHVVVALLVRLPVVGKPSLVLQRPAAIAPFSHGERGPSLSARPMRKIFGPESSHVYFVRARVESYPSETNESEHTMNIFTYLSAMDR